MSMIGELNSELEKLSQEHGIDISAIVSRSGVPIAWHLPDDSAMETFATLSATIIGASEVVYSGLGKEPPHRVTIESEQGNTFVASGLDKKTLIVAMSDSVEHEDLTNALLEAEKRIKEVLSNE